MMMIDLARFLAELLLELKYFRNLTRILGEHRVLHPVGGILSQVENDLTPIVIIDVTLNQMLGSWILVPLARYGVDD